MDGGRRPASATAPWPPRSKVKVAILSALSQMMHLLDWTWPFSLGPVIYVREMSSAPTLLLEYGPRLRFLYQGQHCSSLSSLADKAFYAVYAHSQWPETTVQRTAMVEFALELWVLLLTRGQSNLTKSASRGAHSPVRGHPRGSNLYHWIPGVGVSISVP